MRKVSEHIHAIIDGLAGGKTQRELAEELGITEGRVSQIVSKYRLNEKFY